MISPQSDQVPSYLQLVEYIIGSIKSGKFGVEMRIPSETELSNQFAVSRQTVRQAIDKVKSLGWLDTQQGKGSYVKEKPALVPYLISGKTSFTDNMQRIGKTHQSALLHWKKNCATAEERQVLQLALNEQVYRLEILRYVDKVPFSVTTSVLLAKAVPLLEQYLANFNSLYKILKNHYCFTPVRVRSVFQATFADRKDIACLKMPIDVPVLKIASLMHHPAGCSVEYGIARVRGDINQCSVEFVEVT